MGLQPVTGLRGDRLAQNDGLDSARLFGRLSIGRQGLAIGSGAASLRRMKIIENSVEGMIFGSRWLLAPIYLGMIVAQGLYTWKFLQGLWHLAWDVNTSSEVVFLQGVLGLIDFLMVANLIVMVVIGGYATFVSKLDLEHHPDRPAWLDHIDPGTLKTKLAGALIGVSGIHLLTTFSRIGEGVIKNAEGLPINSLGQVIPNSGTADFNVVIWQVVIHLTFVLSTIFLAWADLLLEKKLAMAHREGIEDKAA